MPSTSKTTKSKAREASKSQTKRSSTAGNKAGAVTSSASQGRNRESGHAGGGAKKRNSTHAAHTTKDPPRRADAPPAPQEGSDEEDDDDHRSSDDIGRSSPPPQPSLPAKRTRVTRYLPSSQIWDNGMNSLDPSAKAEVRVKEGFDLMYWHQRQISRLVGLKVNWVNTISTGIAYYGVPKGRNPYWKCDEYDEIVEAVDVFRVIAEFWPKITFNLDYLGERHDLVDHMAHFCDKVAIKVRGDDLARVKQYMPKIAGFVDHELLDKTNRGWHHDETAAQLGPLRYHEEISADIQLFRRKVKAGDILIHSEDWPLVFYDKALIKPGEYRPGLLRSKELINMARALFTTKTALEEDGPYDGKSKGQPPIAKKYNMKEITFRGIVYVACLLRFLLTSYSDWTETDGEHWNLDSFLYSIYDFAHKNWNWQLELIAWWNKKLFGGINITDEKVEADRKRSAYHVAMINECSGLRLPPSDDEEDPYNPQAAENEEGGDAEDEGLIGNGHNENSAVE